MLTLAQLEQEGDKVADLYAELQQQMFLMMIDATDKQRDLLQDRKNVALWRLRCLANMRALTADVVKAVAQTSHVAFSKLQQLIQDNGMQVADDINSELTTLLNKHVDISSSVRAIISSYLHQTFMDLNNNVNQTLLSTNYHDNAALQCYQDIINKTVLESETGLKTPQQALRDNIYQWGMNGIKTSLIDKGGHRWSLEGYTRTVLNTTVHRVYNDVRMQSMKDFGSTLAVMSSHAAARPACAPIQGQVINIVPPSADGFNDKYDSIYNHGYGTPAGTLGINCKHILFPYLDGVTHNYQKQYDPDTAVKNAAIVAKQRQLERNIRNWKTQRLLAHRLGDHDRETLCVHKISGYQKQLREYISKHDFLTRQYDREQVYSFGNGGEVNEFKPIRIPKDGERNFTYNPVYGVNLDLVNSSHYRNKFAQLHVSKKAQTTLYNEARSMLDHRQGSPFEDLVAIDAKTGQVVVKNDGFDLEHRTAFKIGDRDVIKNNPHNVIIMHNHPASVLPSDTDIKTLHDMDNVTKSVIVGHDGKIYVVDDDKQLKYFAANYQKLYTYYVSKGLDRNQAHDMIMNSLIKSKKVTLHEY